jgi:flagellar hook-basal body complex protein FliE
MNQININSGAPPLPLQQVSKNSIEEAGSTFGNIIKDTIAQTVSAEQQSEKAIEGLASGQARNLHEVMISVEKADISLKMLVQFRNKALQAYEEVMRLQI